MTSAPDPALADIAHAISKLVPALGLEVDDRLLFRTTRAGVFQVVYLYRVYEDDHPSTNRGGKSTGWFKVRLGARLSNGPWPLRRGYPPHLDLDVGVNIGDAKQIGATPTFRIGSARETAAAVADWIEPYGRRWLARYESSEKAIRTLEKLSPSDDARAGDYPGLVAARLRAERGEIEEAQRDLDALFRARSPWSEIYVGIIGPPIEALGLHMPSVGR